jgi:hypothetical protein
MTTDHKPRFFQPNRRCSKHKRPGYRVNPRRERQPDERWPDMHDNVAQLADAGVLPDLEDYALTCVPT